VIKLDRIYAMMREFKRGGNVTGITSRYQVSILVSILVSVSIRYRHLARYLVSIRYRGIKNSPDKDKDIL
jgi:hypothetical protein